MTINSVAAVLLTSAAQSAIIALALLRGSANPQAGRMLALALLTIAGMTFGYVLGWTGRVEVPPEIAFLPINLPLALGPLLYAYVHALAHGRAPPRMVLHLVPAGAQLAYLLIALLLPEPMRSSWKETAHDDLMKPLLEAAVVLSLAAYAIAGLRTLLRYWAWLDANRSDADRFAARWLASVLIAILVTLAILTGMRVYTWTIGELDSAPLQLWFAALAAWLGVEGWRHAGRRFPAIAPAEPTDKGVIRDWAAQGEAWRTRTREAGWWREPALTLSDLARQLGTNTSYLSRAMNDGLGMNFNEMINRMRAEEAARMIERGEGDDLLDVAFAVGFSSKTTFNRVFKAVHGAAPTTYRARLRARS